MPKKRSSKISGKVVVVLGCLALAGLVAGAVLLKFGPFSSTISNQLPVADFSVSSENIWIGGTVQFTDLSVSTGGTISSTRWEFGDGDTSMAKNPARIYSSPGVYTVRLTATDSNGATSTCYKTISVYKMYTFSWSYQKEWHENVIISGELQSYQERSHGLYVGESILKFVTPRDEKIAELANYLKETYNTEYPSAKSHEFPSLMLFFVQSIPYKTGGENLYHWSYPLETLLSSGNCSDKSRLYASLMKAAGYEVCLLGFPLNDHMMAGIHLDPPPPTTNLTTTKVYVANGENYYPCETTSYWYQGHGWSLGEIDATVALETPEITVVI